MIRVSFLGLLVVAVSPSIDAATEICVLDAGSFVLSVPLDREQWSMEANAERQWIELKLLQPGPIRYGSMASYFAFADQTKPEGDRERLGECFEAYLKRKDTPLVREIFRGQRRFKSDPKKHAFGEKEALLRFDMPRRSVMDATVGGSTGYSEHAVVYIYVPSGFAADGRFVVLVGHEKINPDLGHKSKLAFVETMVRGFQLKSASSPR
jgi:hypothetical protein